MSMRRMLLLALVLGALMMVAQPAYAKTLHVGDGGYSSIQDAIDNASSGDMVYVHKGTYEEHVNLNKRITLKGEDVSTTVVVWHLDDVINITARGAEVESLTVEGAPYYRASIRVHANDVRVRGCILKESSYGLISHASGISVKDTTARDNSRYGIAILYAHGGEVEESTFVNNTIAGVHVHDSEDIEVKDNVVEHNGMFGVYIGNGTKCVVKSNSIAFNRYGIWLRKSDKNEIKSNKVSNNTRYGVLLTDSKYHLDGSDDNTVQSNDLNGNVGGVYVYNSRGNLIKSNTMTHNAIHGCILLMGSEQNTIQSNTIRYNRYGVELVSSSHNTIKSNTINDNVRVGVMLIEGSDSNLVDANTAKRCHYGAYVHDSQRNTIEDGTFSDGYVGIYLGNASHNTIYRDVASSNTYGVYLRKSPSNTITKNSARSNANYSYMLDQYSNSNTLTKNSASHSKKGNTYIGYSTGNVLSEESYTDGTYGVVVLHSSSNTLRGCSLKKNQYGVYVVGSRSNTIENCIASPTEMGIILEQAHGNHITSSSITLPKGVNAKGVYISGEGNIVEHNKITSQKNPTAVDGIYVSAAASNKLSANTLNNLVSGILVVGGDDQSITSNDISSCSYGVQIWNAVRDTHLSANTITTSKVGIMVMGDVSNATNTPTNTTVLHNSLKDNNIDVSFLWGTPTAHVNYNDLSQGKTGIGASGVVDTKIDGTYNWWGASDGPGPIAHGHGVRVSANVTYSPWLTHPPPIPISP